MKCIFSLFMCVLLFNSCKKEETVLSPQIGYISVEGGEFTMGCQDEYSHNCNSNEHPTLKVNIKDFEISRYEITNSEYLIFLNEIGNKTTDGVDWINLENPHRKIDTTNNEFVVEVGYELHPVTFVSWYGSQAYANWVGGRLPSEAEWEFAAQGGNKSNNYEYSGSNNIGIIAWFEENNSGDFSSHKVGEKTPNELGIYDMTGNVSEWCLDWYLYEAYENYDTSENPVNLTETNHKSYRGGHSKSESIHCRNTYRNGTSRKNLFSTVGFRVLKEK